MENVSGFVDAWVKAQQKSIQSWMEVQKEFIERWMNAQKELMENWIEATRKLEKAFPVGTSQNSGETRYGTWLKSMEDSAKAFADESGRLQEMLRKTVEKQMDISTDMAENFFAMLKKATEKK